MKFSEYRSNILKQVWPALEQDFLVPRRGLLECTRISLWTIDDICAEAWKADKPAEDTIALVKEHIVTALLKSGYGKKS